MPGLTKKVGLFAGSIIFALVIAEIILRVIGFGVMTPDMSFGVNTRAALEQGRFLPDPDLFWKLPFSQKAQFDLAISAVHPDQDVRAKGSKKRVLVLGDSCSRLSVKSLPYSAALGDYLAGKYQVINASVPGYSSFQGLTWWRTQLRETNPDVVVVYFGWNDHWRTTGWTDEAYARRVSGSGLRLLSLLDRPSDPPPLRVPLSDYQQNLQALVDEIREAGGSVVLVAAPSHFTGEARHHLVSSGYLTSNDNVKEIHEHYLNIVRGFAGQDGVSVLGADQVFLDLDNQVALLHRDGIHLTDEAHQVMGALLAETILNNTQSQGRSTPKLLGVARAALGVATRVGGE